jgi:large subunit ribosomal protein L9
VLSYNKEAKDNGDLFGSIKPKEISSSFINDLKVEISPSQIELKQEINKVGNYPININLHSEVSAIVNIKVSKKD